MTHSPSPKHHVICLKNDRIYEAALGRSEAGLAQLVALSDTLYSWSEDIAHFWRYVLRSLLGTR